VASSAKVDNERTLEPMSNIPKRVLPPVHVVKIPFSSLISENEEIKKEVK
jgi:hypothetical protein